MWTLFKQARLSKAKILLLLIFMGVQIWGTLYLPTLTADIINNGVIAGDTDYVRDTGLLMLGVAAITVVFSILATYFSADIATTFARKIRKQLFANTQKMSHQDHQRFGTPSMITRATNDVEQTQFMLSQFFEVMVPAPFVVAMSLFLAFNRDPAMSLIILIAAVIFLITLALISAIVLPIFARVQIGLDGVNNAVRQYISGIRVIRAFNRTSLEAQRMDDSFLHLASLNIRVNRLIATAIPVVVFVISMALVAILWFGGGRIQTGDLEIGYMVAIIEYTMQSLMYLLMVVFVAIYIPRARVCAKRINEILNYKPEMIDGPEMSNGTLPTGDTQTPSLEFRKVNFTYEGAENPVLTDISFACKPGTTTAIIGGTGSGKSTIAKMIPRLLDASSGAVLFAGLDVRKLPQKELRQRIGFVAQKAFLFAGSIADNIRQGKPDASIDEVKEAASIAQALDFVEDMPDGFGSKVAQGGKNFSGGQRQRLSIARAIIKRPDIYIFDDSFSALDFKTDAKLRARLKQVVGNSVVVIIAQRINTIRDADQIIVVDAGRIVSKGTHTRLMRDCTVYQEIARSQFLEESQTQAQPPEKPQQSLKGGA